MAEKQEKRQYYMTERARALALIYLTRRTDLKIVERQNGAGLDFTIYIQGDRPAGLRLFGVELRAAWSPITRQNADRVIGQGVKEAHEHGPFPFPVCLFFFTMEETQAWYTWVAEPVVDPGKGAALKMHETAVCRELSDAAMDEIVDRVNAWYDARFAAMVG